MVLHAEAKHIVQKIRARWIDLLEHPGETEEAYHSYLAAHAGMFLSDGCYKIPVISKLRLGADLVTDFVTTIDRASYGFTYEFIEIETPNSAPYIQSGAPSSRLTGAVQQIQNWQLWLDANRSEAKKLFPSKEFIYFDRPSFTFTIIIGRRDDSQQWLHLRNNYSQRLGIEIQIMQGFGIASQNNQYQAQGTPK